MFRLNLHVPHRICVVDVVLELFHCCEELLTLLLYYIAINTHYFAQMCVALKLRDTVSLMKLGHTHEDLLKLEVAGLEAVSFLHHGLRDLVDSFAQPFKIFIE